MNKDLLRSLTEPKEEHKHTKGEWGIVQQDKHKIYIGTENFDVCRIDMPTWSTSQENQKLLDKDPANLEAKANAKLICIAPELLQIAEMYLDSMKGTDLEDSLPYQITEKTLKKLK